MAFFVARRARRHAPRRARVAAIRSVGWPGLAAGAFLSCTFFFFIASLTRTTVANTFVLMSVSPFLAAIAGRLVLGERVPRAHLDRDVVAFAGIVVMFADAVDAGPRRRQPARARRVVLLRRAGDGAAQVPRDGRHAPAGDDRRRDLDRRRRAARASVRGDARRPRRARDPGLRPARHRLPARHRRVAAPVGDASSACSRCSSRSSGRSGSGR